MKFYRSLRPIRALSFDLDDTLYENHSMMVEAEKRLQLYLANNYPKTEPLSVKDWRKFKAKHLEKLPQLASDMGELRKRTLRSGLEKSGYQGQELDHAVIDCFDYFYQQRSNFKVDENICSLLKTLAKRVPLVAITNGNVSVEQIGIADYFVHVFKASLTQPMKPHRHMFDLATERLNIPNSAILHVGDNLRRDITGAVASGMQSAWFACDREMHLGRERINVLPHIQLDTLDELLQLV